MQQLTNLLLPPLVLLAACASPAVTLAADNPPAHQPAATDTGSKNSAGRPPLVTNNPDGTMTVQKEPSQTANDSAKSGLVIPPQIVVPVTPAPQNK